MNLEEKIFNAGVVGAGGAGFPTHVKSKSNVEFVLANGAECEPLLHKDYEIMCNFPSEIVKGMEMMIDATNAKKGIFGIKEKNVNAVDAISRHLKGTRIEYCGLGDFYPSGDEYELVYSATNRLIPPFGLPLDVGCVVNNVETLYNVYNAANDIPVTQKFLCVTGAVKNPKSFFVPIGTSIKDLLEFAGGPTVKEFGIFLSGILMGKFTTDLSIPVTKTTAGIIVLPMDHYLIKRMSRPMEDMNRIGKSACDQCSYCTEFCPRYLLGYDVQPHKVMRSLGFTTSGKEFWNNYADLCCSCGLCSLYSCPEDLYPREACDQGKAEMRKLGVRYQQTKPVKVHPMKDGRRVPIKMLMKNMDVYRFEAKTPFTKDTISPAEVKIFLKQHVGVPAKAVVSKGDVVREGDLIGDIETGKLGAKIHASISGRIIETAPDYIVIGK